MQRIEASRAGFYTRRLARMESRSTSTSAAKTPHEGEFDRFIPGILQRAVYPDQSRSGSRDDLKLILILRDRYGPQ
jgi:hypothetical protein